MGGKAPAAAYRRYGKVGLQVPDNPVKTEVGEWVFDGEDLLRRMLQLADRDDIVRLRPAKPSPNGLSPGSCTGERFEKTSHGPDARYRFE
ncbi:hypothetical protein UC8_41050 [Roseimaritima ulvae]|uniref:Uncharacterized protein n=1 Tax=Roseimaritima ulvae TaxID=980254 RepID=A0A5B9QXH7_9BACT|nr:hypothetical protein UC8_41050 [Roseimaritima ulvae]